MMNMERAGKSPRSFSCPNNYFCPEKMDAPILPLHRLICKKMDKKEILENFISLEEVANRLDVSKQTARNWCNKGLLSYLMVNNKCLVSKKSFQAFSSHAYDIEQVQRNITEALDEFQKVKQELDAEKRILAEEINDRRWTNNHIQYFSEMFNLMMHALYDFEDDGNGAKLVKYFLDGEDYKDISTLTGMSLQQVMAAIRRFGRSKLRTHTYINLCREVEEQRETIRELNARLEDQRKLEERIASLEKENEWQKEEGRKEVVSPAVIQDTQVLDEPVSACSFSTRLQNVLLNNGLHTVGQAYNLGRMQLLKLNNMGYKSLSELEQFLRLHNYALPD